MNVLKRRVVLPALALMSAAAVVALYLRKRRREPTFKTIADIRPPRPSFIGYDESKAQPGTYASNHRAKLIAASTYLGRAKEVSSDYIDPRRSSVV